MALYKCCIIIIIIITGISPRPFTSESQGTMQRCFLLSDDKISSFNKTLDLRKTKIHGHASRWTDGDKGPSTYSANKG